MESRKDLLFLAIVLSVAFVVRGDELKTESNESGIESPQQKPAILYTTNDSLSNASVVQAVDMNKDLHDKAIAAFNNICMEIKHFVAQYENENANSLIKIRRFYPKIFRGLDPHSPWSTDEPKVFKRQLFDAINTLEIPLSDENKKNFSKYMDIFDSVEKLQHSKCPKSDKMCSNQTILTDIRKQLKELVEYLKNGQKFIITLASYRVILSGYGIQKRKHEFDGSKITNKFIANDRIKYEVSDLNMKSPLADINSGYYNKIEHLPINVTRLKLLQSVWSQSMLPMSLKCSEDGKSLTVYGFNVMISEAMKASCWKNATSIEFFALNKVIIDVDIEKHSIYLAIIAPSWEVVNSKMKIDLSGSSFNDMYGSNGKDGKLGEKGEDGMPGRPGGSGGAFLGIGNDINVENKLEILITGGDGENGGNGGNGKLLSYS